MRRARRKAREGRSAKQVRELASLAPLAPVLAIIGCDGAGKSTVATHLCNVLEGQGAVYAYLGLGSGALGLKLKALPGVGRLLERRLSAKAAQARDPAARIPGFFTALTIYLFARLRLRRFRKMLAMRAQAGLVVCDRYPQMDVPGYYDGPGLSAALPTGPLTRWLAARERRLYERMVQFRPSLIIRLNIDAHAAFQRKPDHDWALIQKKAAVTPSLRFNGARIVEVDASQSLEDVKLICLRLARRLMSGQRIDEGFECSHAPNAIPRTHAQMSVIAD